MADIQGKKFASFQEVKAWISKYEADNYVQFYVSDSRTIAAAQKRVTKRQLNPDLLYYQVTYACVHGGRKYKPRGSGSRPNQQ